VLRPTPEQYQQFGMDINHIQLTDSVRIGQLLLHLHPVSYSVCLIMGNDDQYGLINMNREHAAEAEITFARRLSEGFTVYGWVLLNPDSSSYASPALWVEWDDPLKEVATQLNNLVQDLIRLPEDQIILEPLGEVGPQQWVN
jgi:hypothetical protein